MEKVSVSVLENAKLIAERGLKGHFQLKNGVEIKNAFITGTNWEIGVVRLECVGERDKPPQILQLNEVVRIDFEWR